MGFFKDRTKEPWHLGDVDLSKLEGESPQRAARVRAYLEGGEQRYQEERDNQLTKRQRELLAKAELQRKLAEQKLLVEQKLREARLKNVPPIIMPEDVPDAKITEEDLNDAHQDAADLANTIEQMAAKMSRALATAIQAIHDCEGDDSFETDDLQMAIAYLAALQDPQD